VSYKNVDILIKSIKLIKEKNPEIKSLIIGDEPEKKEAWNTSPKVKHGKKY